jgi:hypothetical protein
MKSLLRFSYIRTIIRHVCLYVMLKSKRTCDYTCEVTALPKEKLTLSVDKGVVEKAKELGINISEITENVLKGYTSPKPDGSVYDAYRELFESIIPLLREFDCEVKVAESYIEFEDDKGNTDSMLQDQTYLTQYNKFHTKDFINNEDYYGHDIKRIPSHEFLPANEIIENMVDELIKSQGKRKEKLDQIMMAKRIIQAMSESLLKKQRQN